MAEALKQDCRNCRHNTYVDIVDCRWVDCIHPITLAKGPRWEPGDPSFVNMRTADLPLSRLSEVADCPCWQVRPAPEGEANG